MFSPELDKDMPRRKPTTRSQANQLPKEVVNEETIHAETMAEETPRIIHDSPMHNEPPAIEITNLGENHSDEKTTNDMMKEKDA